VKPTIGCIVITLVDPAKNNGADLAPAIITRVWNDTMVNIKTLNDGLANEWKTSVSLFGTEDEARERGGYSSCFWPAHA
jgi:hypothetical protein